jgi:hypothetical protein
MAPESWKWIAQRREAVTDLVVAEQPVRGPTTAECERRVTSARALERRESTGPRCVPVRGRHPQTWTATGAADVQAASDDPDESRADAHDAEADRGGLTRWCQSFVNIV